MKLKGINRLKLNELKSEIDCILKITQKYKNITNASEIEIIQTLYLELGNMNDIIVALNASGFKIKTKRGHRNYKHSDITEVLITNKDTDLGKLANKFYDINRSKAGWYSLVKLAREIKGDSS